MLRRTELAAETLLLFASLLIVGAFNGPLWRAIVADRTMDTLADWRFAIAFFAALVALYFLLIGLLSPRQMLRSLLSALIITSAITTHFIGQFGIVIDPSMVRNVLATDLREAGELFGPGLLQTLGVGVALAAPVWLVRVKQRPWRRAALVRIGSLAAALLAATAALLPIYQDLSSLMRNRHELRYTITPANVLWSTARVLISDSQRVVAAREPPQPAVRTVAAAAGRRPTLLVIVAGETARAANFSLNGYARNTNPELAQLDVVNFPHATACGTSTEVSLPCMFSPYGRENYDEARIRRSESLLHLLARAGLDVVWLDNQSGCKGVCDGLDSRDLSHAQLPDLCADDHCLDEVLLHGLRDLASGEPRDRVVVLHQLGNHGPAYFRRYPRELKRFAPACESNELRDCTREQIVNAYDNAILYTDRFLARTIRYLATLRDRFDVALVYVSDHGESLGEHGLYLHGLPYAIAPREQTEVPMLWWLAPESARAAGIDMACLRTRAERTVSHDNLFHSVLGLLAVSTPAYRGERDLFSTCRTLSTAQASGGAASIADH